MSTPQKKTRRVPHFNGVETANELPVELSSFETVLHEPLQSAPFDRVSTQLQYVLGVRVNCFRRGVCLFYGTECLTAFTPRVCEALPQHIVFFFVPDAGRGVRGFGVWFMLKCETCSDTLYV